MGVGQGDRGRTKKGIKKRARVSSPSLRTRTRTCWETPSPQALRALFVLRGGGGSWLVVGWLVGWLVGRLVGSLDLGFFLLRLVGWEKRELGGVA